MLSVVVLNVIMLSVVMTNVIMLSVDTNAQGYFSGGPITKKVLCH
jgi:hypothetical protein